MKILNIIADADYSALSFEERNKGELISKMIEMVENGDDIGEEEIGFSAEVVEVGDIDKRFLKFIREEVQDYYAKKNSNFYLETEIIKL